MGERGVQARRFQMGLFGWLADRWTPGYEYREYYGHEVEHIAWESTTVGSRRGFLLGFPAGALLTVAVIGSAVMTGLYPPSAPTVASSEGQGEATASQATTKELDALRAETQGLKRQVVEGKAAATQAPTTELTALRKENQDLKRQVVEVNTASQATTKELDALRAETQGLKRQVVEGKAAATCPPCQPQALPSARPPAQAVAAPPQLWPPPTPQGSPRPEVGRSDR
jgi:hypothetical protein